jgi:hypothetical protein
MPRIRNFRYKYEMHLKLGYERWLIWIRTCQHIDGWTDVPKVARARIRAPVP